MKYVIIAGEVSGDLHAAGLASALVEADAEADIRFIGGDRMIKVTGREPEIHCDQLNVMGFSEVIRALPRIMTHLKTARKLIDSFRPDAFIPVDFPDFNMRVAKYARSKGVQTHYYISPKLWAWKQWRVKAIRRDVASTYCILPFEPAFYAGHGVRADYVGNPSVSEIDAALKRIPPLNHFLGRNGIEDERPIIALIPGSRFGEIRCNLPVMIDVAKRHPDFQYIVGGTSSIPMKFYREEAQCPGLNVVFDSTHTLMKHASAALVTSGTATLETALLGTPQVVCYRSNGSRLAYSMMKNILSVKYVSLPNLIVDRQLLPEMLLHDCTVDKVDRELSPLLLPSPARDLQLAGYKEMRRILGTDVAPVTAAKLIVERLKQ